MVRRRRLSGCLGSALLLMAPTTTFFAPSAAPVEPPEVLPKSHLAGALQRAMGRNEVYRSETLFFHRTDETQDRHFALLRIPALPTKKADGTNFIPTEPFEYFEGVGRSRKEAEDQAARQALSVIRKADSEITRWLSWSASTSKQALELASAQIAAPRATDGSSRQWMHRALRRFLRRRALRKSETPFYMRKDEYSGAYHVVLAVPWKETPSDPQRRRKNFFEGTGLEPLLAKESAAEAAFEVLGPLVGVNRSDEPARRRVNKPLREVLSNDQVPAKIRLHQLAEQVLRRTGRKFHRRRDLVYTTKPVMDKVDNDSDDSDDSEPRSKVWFNTTEVTLTMPSLELDSEPLRFSIRVPSWKRARKEGPRKRRLPQVRERYWDEKAEERKAFLAAQQAVAEVALEELLSKPLPVFEEQDDP